MKTKFKSSQTVLSNSQREDDIKRKARTAMVMRYTLISIVAFFMVIPYIWMVATSFKLPADVSITHFELFPKHFTWQNYIESFTTLKVHLLFENSFIVASFAVVLQTAICALAAFALARLKFPGATILMVAFLGTMMVPEEAIMVPLFMLIKKLGMANSYQGMILPIIPWGFSIYMLTQFFKEIPKEIEESAIIDGCSMFRIFWQIILPLAKPALGAVFIFSFLMSWDQMVIPLLVVTDQAKMTIPLGLANCIHDAGENHALLAAASTLATVPSVIIFVCFQKYFIKGLTMGSVKG
jgi:multiple sugar transport system permease protein